MANQTTTKQRIASPMGWFFVCLLAVFIGWMSIQWFRPSPSVRVSKQTTFLTQPLRIDGLPDYRLAKKIRQGKGIAPDRNAATFYWQAMGQGDWEPAAWKALSREIDVPLSTGNDGLDGLQQAMSSTLEAWIKASHPNLNLADSSDLLLELVGRCQESPWKASECVPLAKLITRHASDFDLIYEAANRTVFYSPSAEALIPSDEMDLDFQRMQSQRNLIRAMSSRACLRMGEGDLDGAWKDLRTATQISCLCKPETWIDVLIQVACDGVIHYRVRHLLADSRLTPEIAKDISRTFEQLPDLADQLRSAASGERLFSLSWTIHARENPIKKISSAWDRMRSEWLLHGTVDWNVSLEKINAYFDQVDTILLVKDARVRRQQLDSLEMHLSQDFQKLDSPWAQTLGFVDPSKRSQIVADELVASSSSSLTSTVLAAERCCIDRQLTIVAAKLAAHRATSGIYPVALSELVSQFSASQPVDSVYGSALQYQRLSDTSILLYSLGANGRDDQGSESLRINYRGLDLPMTPTDMDQQSLARILIQAGELSETDIVPDPATLIAADADDVSWRTPLPAESFSDFLKRQITAAEAAHSMPTQDLQ